MIEKKVTYKDYDGVERTEVFRFHLNQSELIEMDALMPGGMEKTLKMISEKKDTPSLMRAFKTILMKAYGEKSADGRRFMKSDEISHAFEETPAYDKIFMELVSGDGNDTLAFIRGIMPEEMQKEIAAEAENILKQFPEAAKN